MHLLEITLDTPAENLALDEALLEEAEEVSDQREYLRLWEAPTPFVVIGRSSKIAEEVQLDRCRSAGVPVLRRCSGGAAIVTGPGCLMYAVVLSYDRYPHLRMIEQAHAFVLDKLATAISRYSPTPVKRQGTSDLAMGDRKFSGNSLRCRRSHLLYHGTLLYDYPLDQIHSLLGTAPRQPDYRLGRSHEAFVTNLPLASDVLRQCVRDAFLVDESAQTEEESSWPLARTRQLTAERYGRSEWNESR